MWETATLGGGGRRRRGAVGGTVATEESRCTGKPRRRDGEYARTNPQCMYSLPSDPTTAHTPRVRFKRLPQREGSVQEGAVHSGAVHSGQRARSPRVRQLAQALAGG
eukprot:SAG11_NODE_15925_length_562_cov_1.341253_1_plen_106_part_01